MSKKFLDYDGLSAFWNGLKSLFNNKVDKVSGKGLSTNDYTADEVSKVAASYSAKHTHSNKTVLDGITSTKVSKWDSVITPSYGSITCEVSSGTTLTIGTTKNAKIILTSIHDASISSLVIRKTNASGGIITTIDDSADLMEGLEIEIFSTYIIVRSPSGNVLTLVGKLTSVTKLYFYLSSSASSDYVSFTYRLE